MEPLNTSIQQAPGMADLRLATPQYPHLQQGNFVRGQIVYHHFRHRAALQLGVLQISLAVLAVIFNGVGISLERFYNDSFWFTYAYAIWNTCFFFTSGGLACATKRNKHHSYIAALLAMSILSVFVGNAQFGYFLFAVIDIGPCDYTPNDDKYPSLKTKCKSLMAFGVLLLFFGLVQVIISIWLAKLCGDHICPCCPPAYPHTVAQYNAANTPVGTVSHPIMMTTMPQGGITNLGAHPYICGSMQPIHSVVSYPAVCGTGQVNHIPGYPAPQAAVSDDPNIQNLANTGQEIGAGCGARADTYPQQSQAYASANHKDRSGITFDSSADQVPGTSYSAARTQQLDQQNYSINHSFI